jgi:hypothetical protein
MITGKDFFDNQKKKMYAKILVQLTQVLYVMLSKRNVNQHLGKSWKKKKKFQTETKKKNFFFLNKKLLLV